MRIIDGLIDELEHEAKTTARVRERVSEAHLAWKPHPKSYSLGQLALHIASVPGNVAALAWRLFRGDRELMAMPRVAFVRAVMLNHWYHRRGQLLVYLRLLDVPVPSVYGPTADESNAFGGG
jgi:hypothetical protein